MKSSDKEYGPEYVDKLQQQIDEQRLQIRALRTELNSLESFLSNLPTRLRKQDILNILEHTRSAIHRLLQNSDRDC